MVYKGYHGDAARTFPVGRIGETARRLLEVTREALDLAIEQARPGNRLSDIGHAVESHVVAHGFSVVREFVGHGIGTSLHEDPQIPNFGKPGRGPKLRPGMVLAIEPMVNVGRSGSEGRRRRLDGAHRRRIVVGAFRVLGGGHRVRAAGARACGAAGASVAGAAPSRA